MEILINLLPMIIIFAVMWLVLILPEKKRRKEYETMLDGIKLNDEVMTRGGIVGTIVEIDGDYMVLESGPNRTRIKFTKNAIANKIYKEN